MRLGFGYSDLCRWHIRDLYLPLLLRTNSLSHSAKLEWIPGSKLRTGSSWLFVNVKFSRRNNTVTTFLKAIVTFVLIHRCRHAMPVVP